MNAKFEAWLRQLENPAAEFRPEPLLRAFVREVNARTEQKMLQTHKLEGSHYAAMRELLKEWGIEV